MVPLSPLTKSRLSEVFRAKDVKAAARLIELECGDNLPLLADKSPVGLERIRFAVLLVSQGDMARLQSACDLAKTDWRDVLVSAGFADDVAAHLSWDPKRRV